MKITMQKLNKHLFPLLVALVLVVCMCCPITASAEKYYDPFDYRDLDYTVRYGDGYNKVTVPLPLFHYYMNVCVGDQPNVIVKTTHSTDSISYTFDPNKEYLIRVYPAGSGGLLLKNIPVGSKLSFDIKLLLQSYTGTGYYPPNLYKVSYYKDSDGQTNRETLHQQDGYNFGTTIHLEYFIEDVPGAISFIPSALLKQFHTVDSAEYTVVIDNAVLEMDISSSYWQQWQNEQNGEKLDSISDGLEDVQDGLYDVEDAVNNSADRVTGAISNSTDKITDAVTGAADEAAKDILNGSALTDNIASESNDEMSAAAGKLDNLGDQLNSVEKPNINTFKVGIGDMIGDTTSIPMLTAPIREIWESPVALGILTIVITLVLVSWVFFGKKK